MKKNRLEITFSPSDNDIWDYLDSSEVPKATLIKSILRAHILGNSALDEKAIEEKIKAAVAKMVPVGMSDNTNKTIETDVFGGKEF